ncbi:acyl-coenzyme A thioesterase 5-like [Neosynchiropus ocellatus]
MSARVQLRLLPSARSLFDEPIQVRVSGLKSRQEVTIRARSTDDKGMGFTSMAKYRANGNGDINLARDESLSGSFLGVEPMGLLWSMQPDTPHRNFVKRDVALPQLVRISVHHEEEEVGMLAEATHERVLMADGVSRVTVNLQNIPVVLFVPPGKGPFPGVLDISTFMHEKRACLLANKGYMVLTAAVFQKATPEELHLDFFEQAVEFLLQHPKVAGDGVGVIARSKASDIALSLAAFGQGIKAEVWIKGCSANVAVPLYYKKKHILLPLLADHSRIKETQSAVCCIKNCIDNPLDESNKGSLIPVEKAEAQFLFVAGEDDLNWDSEAFMDQMIVRLTQHGRNNFESVRYPSAGHLLEPPYGPFCASSPHGLIAKPVLWGGEPRRHVAAEVHLWKKVQDFFRKHLSNDAALMTPKL